MKHLFASTVVLIVPLALAGCASPTRMDAVPEDRTADAVVPGLETTRSDRQTVPATPSLAAMTALRRSALR